MEINADTSFLAERPRATPAQCSRYIVARPHGEYTDHDIAAVIVPAYFTICAPAGVDPLILIAQMIHETANLSSWWSQRPRRNPAGIGVTGQRRSEKPSSGSWQWDERERIWREGVAFPTWKDDAIPAHVGRMLAYALRDDQANPAQRELIAKALSYRPLSRYRGEAPTLRGLVGRWAVPGTEYPGRLSQIAGAILAMPT